MVVSFNLNNTNLPPLPNSTACKPVCCLSASRPFTATSRSFFDKVSSFRATLFFPGNFASSHLHNTSKSLVFDLTRNVPTSSNVTFAVCRVKFPFFSWN